MSLQETKVDRDSTRNQDMRGRRTINASASVDPHDYIIQDELVKAMASLKVLIDAVNKRVDNLPEFPIPGVMYGTLDPDEKPTLRANKDIGYLFHSTDFKHTFMWSGTAWIWGPDDNVRPGALLFTDADPGTGWHRCDGSTGVDRCKLVGDGTLESINLPDTSGAYLEDGTYDINVVAAHAPTINANATVIAFSNGTGGTVNAASDTHAHTTGTDGKPAHLVAELYMRL